MTTLGGRLVRPHDIDVRRHAHPGDARPGRITRLVRVGFEVRVELAVAADAVTVVITRAEARHLELAEGETVWIRTAPGATTVEHRGVVIAPEAELVEAR